jgi:hypothetical protein
MHTVSSCSSWNAIPKHSATSFLDLNQSLGLDDLLQVSQGVCKWIQDGRIVLKQGRIGTGGKGPTAFLDLSCYLLQVQFLGMSFLPSLCVMAENVCGRGILDKPDNVWSIND